MNFFQKSMCANIIFEFSLFELDQCVTHVGRATRHQSSFSFARRNSTAVSLSPEMHHKCNKSLEKLNASEAPEEIERPSAGTFFLSKKFFEA